MTTEGRPTLSSESYKKYSLDNLETWIHDAMNTDDVSVQEIYDVIIGAITEDIDYHSTQLDRRQKLLSLLKDAKPQSGNVTEATPKDWKD
ncbi:MAG: hypothetical protein VW894_07075, partial [Gammaproteobacteria bacterium]